MTKVPQARPTPSRSGDWREEGPLPHAPGSRRREGGQDPRVTRHAHSLTQGAGRDRMRSGGVTCGGRGASEGKGGEVQLAATGAWELGCGDPPAGPPTQAGDSGCQGEALCFQLPGACFPVGMCWRGRFIPAPVGQVRERRSDAQARSCVLGRKCLSGSSPPGGGSGAAVMSSQRGLRTLKHHQP